MSKKVGKNMLETRQDCWPDDDNPSERYLYVTADGKGYVTETRIEIMEEGVYADDVDIIIRTEEEFDRWVQVHRRRGS